MQGLTDLLSSSFAPGGVTVASLVIAILLAGTRGVWYYGNTYRETVKDRDDWKGIAISATATVKDQANQLEKLTEVTEKLTNAINPRRK